MEKISDEKVEARDEGREGNRWNDSMRKQKGGGRQFWEGRSPNNCIYKVWRIPGHETFVFLRLGRPVFLFLHTSNGKPSFLVLLFCCNCRSQTLGEG